MLTAMARELVENKGIGESADSVWRALGQLRPSTPAPAEGVQEEGEIEHAGVAIPAMLPLKIESIPDTVFLDDVSSPGRSSRKTIAGINEAPIRQFSRSDQLLSCCTSFAVSIAVFRSCARKNHDPIRADDQQQERDRYYCDSRPYYFDALTERRQK